MGGWIFRTFLLKIFSGRESNGEVDYSRLSYDFKDTAPQPR